MAPRHLLASVTLLLAVSLVGCSDDSPDAEPDPSDTPTSVSPTDEETEAEKKLSPVKTVRAWVKAYNHLIATGDTTEIDTLSTRSCESCEAFIAPISETHRDGGRYEGGGWKIVSVKRDPDFSKNGTVHTAIQHRAGTIWASKDADPLEYSAEDVLRSFDLVKEDREWRVRLVYRPF